MATRAKALRLFAKKYFNIDLAGMSQTAVLKDLLKKQYSIDAVGNSVVSVLLNAAGDGGGEGGVDFQFTLEDPATLEIANGERCVIDGIPIETFTFNGVTYNWDNTPSEMAEITYTLEIGGKTYEYHLADGAPADCADFVDGATVSVKAIGHFRGVNSTPLTFDAVVSVSENG